MRLRAVIRSLVVPVLPLSFIAVAPSPAPPTRPTSIIDNETVFAELKPDGSSQKVILVDWIRVLGSGRVQVDDAIPGKDIKPLAGTPRPRVVGDRLQWEFDLKDAADLFVTATPTKPLPVDVKLRYFLDGTEVSADRAQGAKGKVKVEGRIHNLTDPFIPLASSVSLSLPIASFTSLDPGDGTATGVGRTVRIDYLFVPRPESTFTYTMDTKKARLPAVSVSLLPQALQDPGLRKSLEQLRSTLQGLQGGSLGGLNSGVAGLASGASLGSLGASGLQSQLTGALSQFQLPQLQLQLPPPPAVQVPEEVQRGADQLARVLGLQDELKNARAFAESLGRSRGRGAAPAPPQLQLPPLSQIASSLGIQLPSLAGLAGGGPLGQLAAGLAQIAASAQQLQGALGQLNTGALKDMMSGLEKAGLTLGSPEEADRAAAFDTFTGKPSGAEGEVRFVYRIAAPQRQVEPAAPEAKVTTRHRSLWDRITGVFRSEK